MTISDIITLVRYILHDVLATGQDIFTYGTSNVFTLTESNVSTVSDVAVNDISSSTVYSYNSTNNKVTITSSLTAGDTVEVTYSFYENYSDTEIESYIRSALVQLSINNYYTYVIDESDDEIYPTPSDTEKNLIATIAAILMEPNNKSYRLPDISITVPNSSLPTDELIRRTVTVFKKNSHGIFYVYDNP